MTNWDQPYVTILERCPSYRQSTRRSKERRGLTLGDRSSEMYVLKRCPLRESRLYITTYSHEEEHDIVSLRSKITGNNASTST